MQCDLICVISALLWWTLEGVCCPETEIVPTEQKHLPKLIDKHIVLSRREQTSGWMEMIVTHQALQCIARNRCLWIDITVFSQDAMFAISVSEIKLYVLGVVCVVWKKEKTQNCFSVINEIV